jgi:hypothetical protein
MSHDPKLKEAMAEIFGILQKHDIAGNITLVSPTHAEFRYRIDPSWSCANLEGDAVRFKSKAADYLSPDVQREVQEATAHMIFQFRDLAGVNFLAFESMVKQLQEVMEIIHKPGQGYEPHREQ